MSEVNVHLKTGSKPNDYLNNSYEYGLLHLDLEQKTKGHFISIFLCV